MEEERTRVIVTEKGLGYLKDLYKSSGSIDGEIDLNESSNGRLLKKIPHIKNRSPLFDDSLESSNNLTNIIEDSKYIEKILFPKIEDKYLTPFMRRKISRIGISVSKTPIRNIASNSLIPSGYDTEGEISIFSHRSKKLILDKSDPKIQQRINTRVNYSENYLEKLIKKHEEVIEKAKKTREAILSKKKYEFEQGSKRENKLFSNGYIVNSKSEMDNQYQQICKKESFNKDRHLDQIKDLHRRKYKSLWSQSQIPDYKRFADLKNLVTSLNN